MASVPKPERPERFSRPTLRERGWTDGLIRRFLPVPDDTAPNPHYKKAGPMAFYDKARVEAIEATEEWQAARSKTAQRQEAAERAVETKLEAMRRHLATVPVPTLPAIEQEELIRRACQHYNRRQSDLAHERGWETYRDATAQSDPAFLVRITVNYCRHRLTPYERQLRAVAGKVGVGLAYGEISRKVYAAIAEAYPWLAEECQWQLEGKVGVDESVAQ